MTTYLFDKSLKYVLVYEGGYSNHPADPGGVTLQGVIQRVYDGYRQNKGLTPKRLTASMLGDPQWIIERNEIYRLNYWDKISADDLPSGIDFVVFDGAVNSGPSQSVKWLQRALGVVADGVCGQATIAAAQAHPDKDRLVQRIIDQRMAFLKRLRTFQTFGKGWTRRLEQVLKVGQLWASGSIGTDPSPAFHELMAQRAPIEDALPAQSTSAADATTGVGAAITTVNGAIASAQEQVQPYVGTLRIGTYILTGLAVAGVVVAAAAIGYRLWAQYENAKRARDLGLQVA